MILISTLNCFTNVLPLIIAVAYMTLGQRKVPAAMQKRKGPNIVGVFADYSH